MKHYGDVSKINGAEIEPVDVITFGSPCQDMSVAGKREGLKHSDQGDNETTRSGLFFEAIRIIKEMRKVTNGEYPKYAVWENVPGAFSSNKGRDFHAVLEALCSVCDDAVSIPEPYNAKRTKLVWNKAGEIVGDNYSVAWRTLDAQYWGVPQRRKRIYLVADFTGRRAREILFKPDSLRGDLQTSDETGQGATADAVGGVDGSSGAVGIDPYNLTTTGDNAATLGVNCGLTTGRNGVIELVDEGGIAVVQPVIALQANGIDRADTAGCNGCGWRENESYTLNTIDRHAVCFEPGAVENKRKYIIRRLTPTECARLQGFPDNWGQLAPYNPADADFWEDVRKTHAEINGKKYKPVKDIKKWYDKLHNDGAEYKAYGNGLALPCAEFVIRGIAEVLRNEKGQFASKGGVIEHKGYTCIYKPEHPRAKTNGYVREHILVAEEMLGRPLDGEEVVHHINGDKADNRPENLEIFPTHAEHVRHHNRTDGKKYSYNGGEFTVAELSEFSVVDYSVLTQRINKLGWDIKRAVETPTRGQPTLGSLFDGIGGFPLAGTMNGIKPLWASEVEPYPIAVTKSRFKEVHNGK